MNKVISKYTGYHRCQGNIAKFKIRIRIREEDSNTEDKWCIKEFSWQDKHFSKIERELLNDTPDLEDVNNEGSDDYNYYLFTYVEKDEFVSEELSSRQVTYLQKEMDKLQMESQLTPNYEEYDFNESLLSSFSNPLLEKGYEKMFIMADMGEYVDKIWIKDEYVLCSLKYDKIAKVLSVYPDFTTSQPYSISTEGDTVRVFHYFIENCSLEMPNSEVEREQELLRRIDECKRNHIKRSIGDKFYVPPKNKLYVYLFFDIIKGRNFENNNLYVEYTLDLPDHWTCESPAGLRGTTQTCQTTAGVIHFGHNFEVVLHYNLESLNGNVTRIPKNPCIYFEVISRGTWDRYRTEGLCFKDIPVSQPGCYEFQMSCFRLRTRGPIGELRRSYIGDYSNCEDVRWIGVSQHEENIFQNKYGANTVSTGELNIRLNILHQSQAFLHEFREGEMKERFIYEKLNSSSLIRSVNQVLLAFRKARNNLIEVRKNV